MIFNLRTTLVSMVGYFVQKREFSLDIQNLLVYYGVSLRGMSQLINISFFLLSVLKVLFVEMHANLLNINKRFVFIICLLLMSLFSMLDVLSVQFVCEGTKEQNMFNNILQVTLNANVSQVEMKQEESKIMCAPVNIVAILFLILEIIKIVLVIYKAAGKAKKKAKIFTLRSKLSEYNDIAPSMRIKKSDNSLIRKRSLPLLENKTLQFNRCNTIEVLDVSKLNLHKVKKSIIFLLYCKVITKELKFLILRSSLLLSGVILLGSIIVGTSSSPVNAVIKIENLIAYGTPVYLALSEAKIRNIIVNAVHNIVIRQ